MPQTTTERPRRGRQVGVDTSIQNLIGRAEVQTEARELEGFPERMPEQVARRNRRFRYHRSFLHLLDNFNLNDMNEHEKFIFYLTYRAINEGC